MNQEEETFSFILLGKNYKNKVGHFGLKESFNVEESLIFKCEHGANMFLLGGSHHVLKLIL